MTLLGPYAGLAFRFTVECNSSVLALQIATVFESLRAPAVADHAHFDVLGPRAQTQGTISMDGELLLASHSERRLYERLLWELNQGAVRETADKVLLHASAAEVAGRAIVMCAPPESGKTTLVGGLMLAGMRYVTDEAVALDPVTGWITPFPKALAVDSGSWGVLSSLRPQVPQEALHLVGRQWQVPPRNVRADVVSSGAVPAMFVIPKYVWGGVTRLQEISPGEALLGVLQETFELTRNPDRDLPALASILERCPCFRLAVTNLDSAVALLTVALHNLAGDA